MIKFQDTVGGLNKWPGMVVQGNRVTKQQATEILIRTDGNRFTFSSNNRAANAEMSELFGITAEQYSKEQFDQSYSLCEQFNVVDLEYLHNHRIMSSYIGGSHGWCNWDGVIFTNNYNIGKWPEVDTVAEEWHNIAQAFPFLDLTCQLYDGETCEESARPVVEYRVQDGNVIVRRPTVALAPVMSDLMGDILNILSNNPYRECGITPFQLRERLMERYGEVYTAKENTDG